MQRTRLFFLFNCLVIAALAVAGCAGQPGGPDATPAGTAAVEPTAALQAATPTPQASPTSAMPATGPEETATTAAPTAEPALPTFTAESSEENAPLTFELVPGQSKARYRVQEQLANLDLPNDAVGETDQVSGSVTLLPDGTVDSASSKFVVNLASLVSDQSRRDNFLRGNVLNTGQFPNAEFVPTGVSGLTWPLPETGDVHFQLTGDLTIRDVTRSVTWDVTGTLNGSGGTGQARTEFTFADFNLAQPRVPLVLSIEDRIILEVDGVMQQSSAGQGQEAGSETPAPMEAAAGELLSCTAPAAVTVAMTEGPYYKPNAPERTSLIEPDTVGTRMVLTGYVLTTDCQPVPNAIVDFWQTDGEGQYDNTGYGMRGQQRTDEQGRYRLETVVPGEYPGRTAHIHVKVQPPGGPVLTTQLFIPGAAGNQTDRIFDQSLLVNIIETGDVVQATYNFVVATA